jgi:hypothetical protein
MNVQWVEKYKPKKYEDLIVNINKIQIINNWLVNFSKNTNGTILVSGVHGVGKNVSIEILLNKLGYTPITLSSNSVKNKKSINDIIKMCNKNDNVYNLLTNNVNPISNKYALIIDDTESISLTNEKTTLVELCKSNDKNKYLPIIFLSVSNQRTKLLTDLRKLYMEYEFDPPNNIDMLRILNNIVKSEKLNISNQLIINSIIKYAQNDIRRLIFILQDLYITYKHDEIDVGKLQQFFNHSQKKNLEIAIDNSTRELLDGFKNINHCMDLFEYNKVVLPLMICENYYRSMFARNDPEPDKNKLLLKQLDVARKVTDSISKGDVIETNIYTDQNWMYQNIHGVYATCNTSYVLNSTFPTKPTTNYKTEFSSDLNKNSLKNINKSKNITKLLSIMPNKSLDDILYMNKLTYKLVKQNKIKEAYQLCKDYSFDIKTLEIIIKIDKSVPKLVIAPKIKKIFCE